MIVGLGNPDRKYLNTRHNVGFEMVDVIASYYDIKIRKVKCKALIGEGRIDGVPVVLAKPQTYMNLSGESVRELCAYYRADANRLAVIYDDVSLDTGRIRIRTKGSAGGHNGMKNIILQLKTDAFLRVRVGIGQNDSDLAEYVLGTFSPEEVQVLVESAKKMPDIAKLLVHGDAAAAMNKYNA